jgi:exodeoxyribonuclease III
MRLVTWNCQGKFREKAAHITAALPDIAVIPECENLERLRFGLGMALPTTLEWYGDNVSKGLGVFSYTGVTFDRYEGYDESIKYCIPLRVSQPRPVNLLAIWAMEGPTRKQSYVFQVYRAITRYSDFIRERDTILMGDLNSNRIFDAARKEGNHSQVVELLAAGGLVSVYHARFLQAHGEETRPTQYMNRNINRPFHLDYCFVPETWLPRLKHFSIGTYTEWCGLSDHCPLFAEFDL